MEYRINLTDDTVEQLGRVLGEPVQELEQEILQKEETIAEKDEIIAEKQTIIDAFPTIESKSITANGTYSEEGKAYSPVTVNVPTGGVKWLQLKTRFQNYSTSIVNKPQFGIFEAASSRLSNNMCVIETWRGGGIFPMAVNPAALATMYINLIIRDQFDSTYCNIYAQDGDALLTANLDYNNSRIVLIFDYEKAKTWFETHDTYNITIELRS